MTDNEYVTIISNALLELSKAWRSIHSKTRPEVPGPGHRVRRFVFAPGVVWPERSEADVSIYSQGKTRRESGWKIGEIEHYKGTRERVAELICYACKWQPRLILRAVRRIEAATRWCEARAAGRKRAAEEILRQQAEAEEKLAAMAAIDAMAKGTW